MITKFDCQEDPNISEQDKPFYKREIVVNFFCLAILAFGAMLGFYIRKLNKRKIIVICKSEFELFIIQLENFKIQVEFAISATNVEEFAKTFYSAKKLINDASETYNRMQNLLNKKEFAFFMNANIDNIKMSITNLDLFLQHKQKIFEIWSNKTKDKETIKNILRKCVITTSNVLENKQ